MKRDNSQTCHLNMYTKDKKRSPFYGASHRKLDDLDLFNVTSLTHRADGADAQR